jgi:hypothetical protein
MARIVRTLLAIMLIGLALPAIAQGWPDWNTSQVFVLDNRPFTIAPCGGDAMPVIDITVMDAGNNPIELIASDVWLDSPDITICTHGADADSSTFRPDAGHTTISGWLPAGIRDLARCAEVRGNVIAMGNAIGSVLLQVNSPDLSGDQRVTVADFGLFAERFQTNDPCADYNEEGFVSVADFGLFAGWFGDCVCAH